MRGSGLPRLLPTERPRCPTCRECMDLQRVDPGMRGFENRVVECARCYTMKAVPAAIGRTKSRSASGPKVGRSAKENPTEGDVGDVLVQAKRHQFSVGHRTDGSVKEAL
jgi:hypothetical protein